MTPPITRESGVPEEAVVELFMSEVATFVLEMEPVTETEGVSA